MEKPRLHIDVVTIFPEMFAALFGSGMVKRALDRGLVCFKAVDLRHFARGRHRQVDDAPYGGGSGMIFKPEPLFEAVESLSFAGGQKPWVVLLTPQGRSLTQAVARELAGKGHLILLCGRYEGVDERIRETLADDEISIGDYILTGGEPAAAVVIDAVFRLVPGFLEAEVLAEDSFAGGLLEYPQYTRPPVYREMAVPDVLLSGDHGAIARWRRRKSLQRTLNRRPDLLLEACLSPDDHQFLRTLREKETGKPEPE